MLSSRAKNLKTSPTLFLVAKAKELSAQGHDVISLTVGEPDWPTYPAAAEAGINAIKSGFTKYTAANGMIELRQAISEKLKFELGQDYPVKNIMVGPGAKFVIFSALQMLCDRGDEVIIHSPYWVSYPTMAELADGVPKIVTCGENEGFKITAEQLEKAITPKTKVFLFCSPSNPTGFVYSRTELERMAAVLRKHPQIVVISDDMYNRLMFDGSKVAPHLLQVAPDLKERVVAVNGGSKAYSMTGWRIGWAAGPSHLIQAMGDYQSQSTGAPSSIAQQAALAALKNCEPQIAETNQLLLKRLKLAKEAFAKIPEFKVFDPQGAFYLWVDISKVIGRRYDNKKIEGSKDFSEILLSKFFVATVPGAEFGNEGYLRLSFATSEKRFAEAVDRMADLVNQCL